MKKMLLRICLTLVVLVTLVFAVLYFSMTARHYWAMAFVHPYPVCIDVIESLDFISHEFDPQSVKMAPPYAVIWSKIIGTYPDYLMMIEVQGIPYGSMPGTKPVKGRAQISLYSSETFDDAPKKVGYTMSWTLNEKSRDLFGTYETLAEAGN